MEVKYKTISQKKSIVERETKLNESFPDYGNLLLSFCTPF